MESGRQLGRAQSRITLEGLNKMGDELIRLCDGIERHGLVDYQYGVWEEQITEGRFSQLYGFGHYFIGSLTPLQQYCSNAASSTNQSMMSRQPQAPVVKSADARASHPCQAPVYEVALSMEIIIKLKLVSSRK